jgi:hypothetical protein
MAAKELLVEIANPGGRWNRIPKDLRLHAMHCLRHYPNQWDMKQTVRLAPDVFQERMEPVTKMLMQYQLEQKEEQNDKTI